MIHSTRNDRLERDRDASDRIEKVLGTPARTDDAGEGHLVLGVEQNVGTENCPRGVPIPACPAGR